MIRVRLALSPVQRLSCSLCQAVSHTVWPCLSYIPDTVRDHMVHIEDVAAGRTVLRFNKVQSTVFLLRVATHFTLLCTST